MHTDMYQVELIGSGSLSIMAKPVSGEWIDNEFANIRKLGINRIVSLLEVHEAIPVGLENEKEITEKHHMEFMSYPIPDRGLPTSIHSYLKFTKTLYDDIANGLNTVIHCRAGIGRTGMIAAGVLLHSGFEPAKAFKNISEKRGVEVPDTHEQVEWVMKSYKQV